MLKRLNNVSIVYKLSGIISFPVIVSMLLVGVFTYTSNKRAIISRTYEQLTSVRFEKTQRVQNFVNNKILELEQLASTSSAVNVFECLNKDTSTLISIDVALFNQNIGNYLKMQAEVNRFIIVDEGKEYAIKPGVDNEKFSLIDLSFLPDDYFNSNGKQDSAQITDLLYNDKGEIVFYIFTKINCSKNNVYIGFEMPSFVINRIMLEDNPYNGLGASGEVYLVGKDLLMRSQSRFIKNSVLKIKVPNLNFDEIHESGSGTSLVTDYRGVKVLSSSSPISWGDTHWMILAEIDYKEALIPVDTFRNSIIFLGLLGTIMFTTIIMLLIISITRPVSKLKKAADEISLGNYNVTVPVSNKDEIGQLSSTFNLMASKIDEQKKKLDYERMNRLSEMIDWQESERQRLSRELHDGIGQLLLSVNIRLGRITGKTSNDIIIIEETQNIIKQAVQDVRDISNDLMPAVLNEFGIIFGIKNLCEQIRKDHNIQIEFKTNILEISDRKISTYLYRIVQEVLSNTVKYSKAKNVVLDFTETNVEFILKIKDDGQGFNQNKHSENLGNGLRNIRERAVLLNGSCSIESSLGFGTQIIVNIPKKK